MQLQLNNITYTYPEATSPVFSPITATFPQGWTGIIGDNGCGKTTLASIAARILKPNSGNITPKLFSVYCPQDSAIVPDNMLDLAYDWGREGRTIKEALALEDDWFWRFNELSGGQRKRIQIGCALYARPDVLVMDEPTNNLDAPTKAYVHDVLANYRGIGILISHDRALLDSLVEQSLVFEGDCAHMRPGGYTQASTHAEQDRVRAQKERANAAREVKRLKKEADRRREDAARQKGKRSRANLDKKDSDGRERIGRAIVSGKDGVAGKLSATMDRRLDRAQTQLARHTVSKRYTPSLKEFGNTARVKTLVHLPEGTLRAGEFSLTIPELWISPTDHIALTGQNGTGKSLLVREIVALITESVTLAYLPQEVDETTRAHALTEIRSLDQAQRGLVLSIVAKLNSDPDRILEGDDISPGELRKLLLSMQLVHDPHLIVLDEPTNHLDVGSITALQDLLVSFPGAVLVVSHDEALTQAVGTTQWKTEKEDNGSEDTNAGRLIVT